MTDLALGLNVCAQMRESSFLQLPASCRGLSSKSHGKKYFPNSLLLICLPPILKWRKQACDLRILTAPPAFGNPKGSLFSIHSWLLSSTGKNPASHVPRWLVPRIKAVLSPVHLLESSFSIPSCLLHICFSKAFWLCPSLCGCWVSLQSHTGWRKGKTGQAMHGLCILDICPQ